MTQTTIILDTIAEAARWHLLALLFERPRPGWDVEVRAIAGEVADVLLRAAAEAAADTTDEKAGDRTGASADEHPPADGAKVGRSCRTSHAGATSGGRASPGASRAFCAFSTCLVTSMTMNRRLSAMPS